MNFPEWDNDPEITPEKRAARRLKFIFMNIMAKREVKPTIESFCTVVGIKRTHINYAFQRGRCPPGLAIKIEKAFGRDVLPHEHLTDPLSIKTEAINA